MSEIVDFFDAKFPWSKYKDLILDYYLRPYLAKVARLRKPIAVVDCFAGPGRFKDGNSGSPLIISHHLMEANQRGTEVLGVFVEENETLFSRLKEATRDLAIPHRLLHGDFHQHVDDIVELTRTHSVFLYLDPIFPGDLRFDDLAAVYQQLRSGVSVEVLVNFISPGFVRRAQGLRPRAFTGCSLYRVSGRESDLGRLDPENKEVIECNRIAGGDYWQNIVFDSTLSQADRVEAVATEYVNRLRRRWFPYVIKYPIREKYEYDVPKYHLIFGSRSTDAVELMNRAMVTARREFVGAQFVDGQLFANEPAQEVIDESAVSRTVIEVMSRIGVPTTWKELRVAAIIQEPCRYTESDWNRGIKKAVAAGKIQASVDGSRIVDDAQLWAKNT
ncbi:MAG: three-Cys-motif partner protein TcmP [Phycisphaeraceae bacterium]